jgi:hypothetical protein
MLGNAFGSRLDSDYDLLFAPGEELADDILRDALQFVKPAEKYLQLDMAVDLWLEHGIYPSTRVRSLDHWRRLGDLGTQIYRNIQLDGIDLLEHGR